MYRKEKAVDFPLVFDFVDTYVHSFVKRCVFLQGVGLASFVIGFLGLIPYMMIMAWGLLYLANTFTIGSLPWMTCGKSNC